MNESIVHQEKRLITGPAGVFFNTKGEILGVREREGEREWKTRKRAGQLFVPGGKKRSHETLEAAMIREVWEEAGIKEELHIIQQDKLDHKWTLHLETHDTNLVVEVFGHKEHLDSHILEKHHDFFSHEIIQRAFFNIREILEWDIDKIRPWLYEILYIFYGGKIEETIQIENGKYRMEDIQRIDKIRQEMKYL